MNNEETLTTSEAYQAMIIFLENLYSMTKSDDLAGFLGGFQILSDGSPADPAAWHDWLEAIDAVKNKKLKL